jgi:hypothetical protein
LMVTLTSNVQGSQSSTIDFSIANATTLFNTDNSAFNNLGGPEGSSGSDTFDVGLPFFFGVNVYTAIEGMTAGGAVGPYFAF